jgi:uncharacterized protein (DUF2147 family)
MKTKAWIVGCAIALLAGAGTAAADSEDVTGLWRTPDGATVQIDTCGASFCGRIAGSPEIAANPDLTDAKNKDSAQRSRRLRNLTILTGFHRDGGAWVGGHAYDPHTGGTYVAKLRMTDPATLKLTGCIAAALCQTQTWTRAR